MRPLRAENTSKTSHTASGDKCWQKNLNALPFSGGCDTATRGAARTCDEALGRSTVAHFARKVRGRILWRPNTAKKPTKSCAKALDIFATCSWPSLCEQSELQCWRRNRRLCGPAQISAARALLPIFKILKNEVGKEAPAPLKGAHI